MKELNFNNVYNLYKDFVFNTAMQILNIKGDAEDVSQEVFIKVHLSLSKGKVPKNIETWIYIITKNACIDYMKTIHKDLPLYDESIENTDVDIEGGIFQRQVYQAGFKVVEDLGDKYLLVYDLYFNQGYGIKDIAKVLSIGREAARSRLHKINREITNRLG